MKSDPRPFTPDQVGLLVDRAGRAPSVHNTQPWSFEARGAVVEMFVDPTRALPVADPEGRERLISCGAALFNLRLTMRHIGYEALTVLMPDGPAGRRVASVERGRPLATTADEARLYAEICRRRTHRRPFHNTRLSDSNRRRLEMAAMGERAWVSFVDDPARVRQLARLMATAAAADGADPAYRAELGQWIRGREPARDGVPMRSLGVGPYPIAGLPRHDTGADLRLVETIQEELTQTTALVLGSLRETPRDWLETGQALQALLLEATASGLVCSFANQTIEQPALRDRLSAVLETPGHPQLLMRVGHPLVDVPSTPRRHAADLLR
jgi:nitroreductase